VNVDSLPAISLDGLNASVALLARVDRKYVIDAGTLSVLLDEQHDQLMALDIDGVREFTYESVYFDTPELGLYRAAATGRRRRFKVRTRLYVETDVVMLEVKTKDGRGRTIKHRMPRAAGPPRDRLTADDRRFVDDVVGHGMSATLVPTLTTRYRRTTLVDVAAGSRATVDRDLECSAPSDQLVTLDRVVVETKSGIAPSPIDRWLWRHGARPERFSKYSTALAVLHPGLFTNRWHRTIQRHLTS
jgi:hypothetical protein